MLTNKISLQTKLFLYTINNKQFFNTIVISKEFIFGFHVKNFSLNSNILHFYTVQFIKIIFIFFLYKKHILMIFSEIISIYFILQVSNLFIKKQHKISLINENNWYKGSLINNFIFKKPFVNKYFFELLVGFKFKPEIVILFGLNNYFIIRDLIFFDLPLIIFSLKITSLKINKNIYFIPSINANENFLFIFIVKYAFLN